MTEEEREQAYAKASADLDVALTNMVNLSGEAGPQKMVTEFVIFTASTYMEDENLNSVTSYGWFCTPHMSHSHLLGLMVMGHRAVDRDLEDHSG